MAPKLMPVCKSYEDLAAGYPQNLKLVAEKNEVVDRSFKVSPLFYYPIYSIYSPMYTYKRRPRPPEYLKLLGTNSGNIQSPCSSIEMKALKNCSKGAMLIKECEDSSLYILYNV